VPAPVCLIVNPAAGGGKAGRLAPDVERELKRLELQCRRADTRDLAHARELAVEAVGRGETVVALSGDGLVGVLADELRQVPDAVLGVLPGGRGNDLARVLGIPEDAITACATIAAGVTRKVDLGLVRSAAASESQAAFVGIASVGFDSDANRIANEAPAWLGGMVYAYGALRALLGWRDAHFEIELKPSGELISFDGYSVAAANSKAYGGGMHLAPDALLDDGLLDLVLIEKVSKLQFLMSLPKVFSGEHVHQPTVRVLRAAELLVSADRPFTMYADGDPIGELPVHVSALAGAVTMLVPAGDGTDSAFSTQATGS
jgi:YegS/Rv2252/BmrU family lipid kinase